MATATEHCRNVLAAIIPGRRDLLERAQRHLTTNHFPDRALATLFTILERYADITGGFIATREAIADNLQRFRVDAGTIAAYVETYDLLHAMQVDEAGFLWSLDQVRDLAADRATKEALNESMEILTRGGEDEHGKSLQGHVDARQQVMARFAEIDRDLAMQEAPEGDMRTEGQDILADYAARRIARMNGRAAGIDFGIPALDAKVGGITNGDLVLLVGYTSDGKTGLCVQLAWNACVTQGKNVVFLTTETPKDQVRRRLLSRHSMHEPFGLTHGLNSRSLKDGTLTPQEELLLPRIVQDFEHNPGYGKCWISQVPRGASMSYVESKLLRLQRMFPIDLVIMDYLALLKAERRRNSNWEELSTIFKDAKQLTVTFDNGTGIPLVSPHQVSRAARMEALKSGAYNSSALAESAEASNSPDLIVSLLAPDHDDRYARLRMQVMKNRDGECASSIAADIDYATSRFGPEGSNPGSVGAVNHAFADNFDLYQ